MPAFSVWPAALRGPAPPASHGPWKYPAGRIRFAGKNFDSPNGLKCHRKLKLDLGH